MLDVCLLVGLSPSSKSSALVSLARKLLSFTGLPLCMAPFEPMLPLLL